MSFPPILPAPSSHDAPSADAPKGRKRRTPSHVSLNACTACKRARAKCDGEAPDPCSRCVARDVADQCHYEVHVKTAKEDMVRRIRTLEQQNAALLGSMEERERAIRKKDLWIETFFNALKEGERGPEVVAMLQAGQSYDQIVEWLGQPPYAGITHLSPSSESRLSRMARNADAREVLESTTSYETAMDLDASPESQDSFKWTNVDVTNAQSHHLMALYFTWIHPVHMLFSEDHFMGSFQKGSNTYCSISLFNAICALGCLFMMDREKQRASSNILFPRFLKEARNEVGMEDRTRPTFASTYAVLFLIGISSGEARKASAYLRLAAESILHIDASKYDPAALEITSWGIHTLNIAWAGFTYQKPFAPVSSKATVFKNVKFDTNQDFWQPYQHPADATTTKMHSHAIRTAKELAGLNRIIMNTINVYCGSRGPVTAQSILQLYRKYLEWKAGLPSILDVGEDDSQKLPHVYFLHAYYHVALCQLFQPLLYHRFSQTTLDHIKSITVQTAQDGFKILQAYQQSWSYRYQVPLQLFCLVHICDALVRFDTPEIDKPELVEFCLKGLHEASPSFSFVGPLQFMFLQTVREQGVATPANLHELMDGRTHYGPEDLLDACERVTYVQPIEILLQRFDPGISADFEPEWQEFIESHGSGGEGSSDDIKVVHSLRQARRSMQIGSFVN
ncbi:uncharacterized protein BDZ99DRAFT_524592 [Mytilinidion resinicola]|uniref:Zn(2)-C6 fungal-type domain-containing protein n=1 Tax=Mytilinidion resinicola TaxID=574789 RepID=A0A6A6Y9Y1_9PEZI|nr:uncharacterized protein BDZ99DRAFT_524592 [Mytilinidion resinicola]KAF2805632.1 hypothetical protein BDZ99DRAFT_524592 [Mytilinidion resinicola]